MIRINLATKKQIQIAGVGGTGDKANVNIFQNFDADSLKQYFPIVRKIAVPVLVLFLAGQIAEEYKARELKSLDEQITNSESQQRSLQSTVDSKKMYEAQRKIFEQDEFNLRKKLETIQGLISTRDTTNKILLALSSSVPAEVWITSFKRDFRYDEKNNEKTRMVIFGEAKGFTPISEFIKNLSETEFFKNVSLKNTQAVEEKGGLEVATFELEAEPK
ncbi:PilN domain-containing protein [bacterium]|nr:PilN domain-containing protein [bacterium]